MNEEVRRKVILEDFASESLESLEVYYKVKYTRNLSDLQIEVRNRRELNYRLYSYFEYTSRVV